MEIDIYDFDKTIIPFDSGSLFTVYCMLRYPWCMIHLPVMAVAMLLMLTHVIHFTQFKKTCFMFVKMIPLEKAVKKFWDKHEHEVHPWFYEKKKERYSVVISASPDFLLEEIDRRLGFDKLICTLHNRKTGVIIGENCRKEEKVKRLFKEFNKDEIKVINVYSDSLDYDRYIFSLGENCFHVVKGELVPFRYEDVYKDKK